MASGTIKIIYNDSNNIVFNNDNQNTAVFPVTSDLAVYNILNVPASDYVPHINVNAFINDIACIHTVKNDARRKIPQRYRHNGIVLTYLLIIGEEQTWYSELYKGDHSENIESWEDDDNWIPWGASASSGDGSIGTLSTSHDSLDRVYHLPLSGDVLVHDVARTGKNIDLIDFVGKRTVNGGEIFSTYERVGDGRINPNTADGTGSAVFGSGNTSGTSAPYSFVMGLDNTVNTPYSFTGGEHNTNVNGEAMFVFGGSNVTGRGKYGTVFGFSNNLNGTGSLVSGIYNTSVGDAQTVIGRFNSYQEFTETIADFGGNTFYYDDYAFIIGNGTGINNRSNAFSVLWNGTAWAQNDVLCGNTPSDPVHMLTQKYDYRNLENVININDTNNGPASIEAVRNLYRQFVGDHRTYFFLTLQDMVRALLENNSYLDGDMLYVVTPERVGENELYPSFFIANITEGYDNYMLYPTGIELNALTFEKIIEDIYTAVAQGGGDMASTGLGIGYYRIGRLINTITFGEWQSVLYDRVVQEGLNLEESIINFRTINGQSLLYNASSSSDNIEINIPVENTVDQNNTTNAVSGSAVYNYVNENTVAISNLKTLDTNHTDSQYTNDNESLVKDVEDTIKLHKVSKTGYNTDLLGYVGRREYDAVSDKWNTGEIFNCYPDRNTSVANVAEAIYSHAEGYNNKIYEDASYSHAEGQDNQIISASVAAHVSGKGNVANYPWEFVIGTFNKHDERFVNTPLFLIGDGKADNSRSNAFIVFRGDSGYGGNTWISNKVHVGSIINPYGVDVPEIQIGPNDNPNVLVNKYYVDQLFGNAGLYLGLCDNDRLPVNSSIRNGSLYNITSITETRDSSTIVKDNVLGIYSNSNESGWKKLYDVLTFKDNPKDQPFYIIGGYKGNNTDNTDIELHTVAHTGNYYDLKNRPSFTGLPTTHILFDKYRVNSPEPEYTQRTLDWQCQYYIDNKVAIVFDCDPQWVCDSILNNSSSKHYIYLQRLFKGQWRTIRSLKEGNNYRTKLLPVPINTYASQRYNEEVVINAVREDGVWSVINSHKKIGFVLPYTVRDILMAFMEFKDSTTAGCLWDLVVHGNGMRTDDSNFYATFDKRHFMLKGLENSQEEGYIDMNAFAVHFRIGVVEQPDNVNAKMFYGPAMWNNFKAMLTSRFKSMENRNIMYCLGKFTSRKIRT